MLGRIWRLLDRPERDELYRLARHYAIGHRQDAVASADHVFFIERGRVSDQGISADVLGRRRERATICHGLCSAAAPATAR